MLGRGDLAGDGEQGTGYIIRRSSLPFGFLTESILPVDHEQPFGLQIEMKTECRGDGDDPAALTPLPDGRGSKSV